MMERVLEAELVDDPDQAAAYAQADFAEENQGFVDRFREYFPTIVDGHLVDLGCGPADIPLRLLRALPTCRMTAVDASEAMIALARTAVIAAGLDGQIALRCERVQTLAMSAPADGVISNSLVHHLPNPLQFWHAVRRLVKPGGAVLVMDLLRPESEEDARGIVEQYAAEESPILRRDFFNSLRAALTEDEVAAHLAQMNLSRLLIDVIDDRHWVVSGHVV